MLRILFTTQNGTNKNTYFPPELLARLEKLGSVVYNPNSERAFSEAELCAAVRDVDVCLTHWGCPRFTPAVLENANRLRLIAHAAGTVADLVSPEVYARGIRVCSANPVMARYVAEGTLAYILAGLRRLPQQNAEIHAGGWERPGAPPPSLFGARVGLVGLGTVGRYLLELLAPFGVKLKVYDPYLAPGALDGYPAAATSGLEEVLAWADVISVHASLTAETRGLLNAERLALMRGGALLVNTARGPIVDEAALERELRAGRLNAVLDVFTREPLPAASGLRGLDNVLLFPHSAAGVDRLVEMSEAMLAEIARFAGGEPLEFAIPLEKFNLMTREREFKIYA